LGIHDVLLVFLFLDWEFMNGVCFLLSSPMFIFSPSTTQKMFAYILNFPAELPADYVKYSGFCLGFR